LSWSAYLALADCSGTSLLAMGPDPGISADPPESGGLKRAMTSSGTKSGMRHCARRGGRPVTTTPEVDRAMRRLSKQGLGVRTIAKELRRDDVHVSPRTVARRLRWELRLDGPAVGER
jgi:hypothetical protein